jgi:hypothetical protein
MPQAHVGNRAGPESSASPPSPAHVSRPTPPAHVGDRGGAQVVRRPASAVPRRRSRRGPGRLPAFCRRPTSAIKAGPESSYGLQPPANGGDRGGAQVIRRPAAAGPLQRSRRGTSRPSARCRRPTSVIEAGPKSSAGPPPPAQGDDRAGPESSAGTQQQAHGGDRGRTQVDRRPAAAGPPRRSRRGPSSPPVRRRRPTSAIEAGPKSSAGPPSPAHVCDRGGARVVRRPADAGPRRRSRRAGRGLIRPLARRRRPKETIEAGPKSFAGPPMQPEAQGSDRGGAREIFQPAAIGPRWLSRRGTSRPPARRRRPTAAIEAGPKSFLTYRRWPMSAIEAGPKSSAGPPPPAHVSDRVGAVRRPDATGPRRQSSGARVVREPTIAGPR